MSSLSSLTSMLKLCSCTSALMSVGGTGFGEGCAFHVFGGGRGTGDSSRSRLSLLGEEDKTCAKLRHASCSLLGLRCVGGKGSGWSRLGGLRLAIIVCEGDGRLFRLGFCGGTTGGLCLLGDTEGAGFERSLVTLVGTGGGGVSSNS